MYSFLSHSEYKVNATEGQHRQKFSGDQNFDTNHFYIRLGLQYPNTSSDIQYQDIRQTRGVRSEVESDGGEIEGISKRITVYESLSYTNFPVNPPSNCEVAVTE